MVQPNEVVVRASSPVQPRNQDKLRGREVLFPVKTLGDKQREFPLMLAALITWAYENGYELTLGEAYRTPEQAAINAAKGIGIVDSAHTRRLAIDLNLFKDGVYLTKTEEYTEIGEKWEELGGSWGGRFNDGNHFSLAHNGVR